MSIDNSNELQEAADRAAKGITDPEAAKRARKRMDETREAIRKRVGTLDEAVPLIRSHREE